MEIDNHFIAALAELIPGAELSEDGVYVAETPFGDLTFVVSSLDQEFIWLRTEVGELGKIPDRAAFERELLVGNRFGLLTGGAVLSLAGDRVYLTARLDDDDLVSGAALKQVVAAFIETLRAWRTRLEVVGGKVAGKEVR